MGTPESLGLPVTTVVAVVGAGAMGAGIAQVAAVAGHPVRLIDARPGAAEAAVGRIRETLTQLVAKKKIDEQYALEAAQRLSAVGDMDELDSAGLVIEAIVEDLEAKRQLFAQLAGVVPEDCILATNTSSISVTAIAAKVKAPQRVVGMHFFNPAPQMALVEIVAGLPTSPEVMQRMSATAAAWGKVPVQAKSTPGFIVNRCARPFYAEGLRLLLEQAGDCATIDAIMRESGGFRMGPFELMDLIGHDVNYAVTKSVFDANYGDPRYTPSLTQLELVHAGFLGRKAGRGFYDYKAAAPPQPGTERAESLGTQPVTLCGVSALARALAQRLDAARHFHLDIPTAGSDGIVAKVGDAVVLLTDGRTATQRALDLNKKDLVLVDLALDFASAKRIALAKADSCSDAAYRGVVAMMQLAGYAVSQLQDVPGMAVMRTVAMLANEAAEAVNHGVCTAEAADLAMLKGVNYPRGPLAWADGVGPRVLAEVLVNLSACYGEDRYRVSTLLRRRAASGAPLSSSHA
jgi:3-hydroxybutyryl-CoA dehydrogenase